MAGMDAAIAFLYISNMTLQAARSIPNYDLYGELAEMPDILHCETIPERATLHNWNIRPHRHHRLHQFFLVVSGGGSVEIDGRTVALDPPLVINIPPLAVHTFAFRAGTGGWVITVPVDVLDAGRDQRDGLAKLIAAPAAAAAEPGLIALFDNVAREHANAQFGRTRALRAYVELLAAEVARHVHARGLAEGGSERGDLARRFEALVEQHFREHWTVGDYAGALAISPTHLSRLTRAQTGLSASRLVEARLTREARRLLAYTAMTVSQIAYELGFDDPAYFTRVFTRAVGRSPSAYRRNLDRPYHDGSADFAPGS